MPIRSGQLRHSGRFQIKSIIRDTYGEDDVTWIDDVEANVAIYPVSGKEYYVSQQTQSVVTHRIFLRYTTLNDGSKINPNCRFVHDDGTIFNIQSVINKEMRDIELTLMAIEEV